MAFVLSNWGPSSLDWLQHGTCTGSCDTSNTMSTISNIRFNTSGAVDAPLDYETYKYGTECGAW